MDDVTREFVRRANRIPSLGIGLSVDVYSPDVFELLDNVSGKGLSLDYLEIFQAPRSSLQKIRSHRPSLPMAYHAEGIWVTQPDWDSAYCAKERLSALGQDLGALKALWVNQECASKEIGGKSFGTYLPPIFSEDSAHITGRQSYEVQTQLDELSVSMGIEPPLFCLEGPPLSYFAYGNLSYAEFFSMVIEHAPCGLVLDIGHAWTVYRYGEGKTTESFTAFWEDFLGRFPLERVIQIHLAGLACHPYINEPTEKDSSCSLPFWIDAHDAPIPSDLWTMLVRVLAEPRLTHLKGIALEVDNKSIPLICEELTRVKELVNSKNLFVPDAPYELGAKSTPVSPSETGRNPKSVSSLTRQRLTRAYEVYVRWASGHSSDQEETSLALGAIKCSSESGRLLYANQYLPHEILCWGGNVREMFPRSCRMLDDHGIALHRFFAYWFSQEHRSRPAFDFFLLKIELFERFFLEILPEERSIVQQEAEELRDGYALACEG